MRFPGFSGEWEVKRLGNLLEFKNGINASKEQYGKGFKFINILDILNNDFINYDNIVGRVDVDSKIAEKYSVKYGDMLFQRSSETREEVGTANVYLDKENTATFGGFVIRGRKIGDYNPIFFNKLLKTNSARESITSKSGGSTRYNVGQEILTSITLYFPSLPEQDKIASLLSLIDNRIQTQSKIIQRLESLMQGLRERIFKQQIRFRDENGKCFPDWRVNKLGDVCEIAKSGGTPRSTNKEYYEGDIPFLSISDMTSQGKYLTYTTNSISQLGLDNSSSWIVPVNSIIYSMYASVGFVAINRIPLATSQAVLNLILETNINIEFVYYHLVEFQKKVAKFITTGTQGNLNAETVKGFEIPIPSLTEQNKITSFMSSIDQKIQTEKAILKQLEKQKKYLLQQMFI